MMGDIIEEYTDSFAAWARTVPFDLIHAHDWVTFPTAMAVSRATGKPWIAHFHSTEADRHAAACHPGIEGIERRPWDLAFPSAGYIFS